MKIIKEKSDRSKKSILGRIFGLIKRKRKDKVELPKIKKEVTKKDLSQQPTSVESEVFGEKFSFPSAQETRMDKELPQELPTKYGKNEIVIQTRDPWWIHAYWDVTDYTKENL